MFHPPFVLLMVLAVQCPFSTSLCYFLSLLSPPPLSYQAKFGQQRLNFSFLFHLSACKMDKHQHRSRNSEETNRIRTFHTPSCFPSLGFTLPTDAGSSREQVWQSLAECSGLSLADSRGLSLTDRRRECSADRTAVNWDGRINFHQLRGCMLQGLGLQMIVRTVPCFVCSGKLFFCFFFEELVCTRVAYLLDHSDG